ncbi:MAG TPA: septal ring lytic transglycosylase RlpA family protein, partial [Rhodospirillales bacterium]|nr:septal ring lytic transglycosylase RlpA family protein [Rhodospirillales bacterium]
MRAFLLAAVAALFVITTAPAFAAPAAPSIVSGSFYHSKFEGRRTACGDRYDSDEYTAASNRHPCDAVVRVTRGSRSVLVRINDRCGRCGIDLTPAAAREIGLHRIGRAPVHIER